MKQIKTVVEPIDGAAQFDATINRLLGDGWELKKRTVIDNPGDLSDAFNFPVVRLLYAELERKHIGRFEEITL